MQFNSNRWSRTRAAAGLWLTVHALACTASGDEPREAIVTEWVSHSEVRGAPAGPDLATSATDYLRSYQTELGLAPAGDFVAIELPAGFEGVRRASAQQIHDGLPVVGSAIDVRAGADGFLGFSGLVTRNLDGFDTEPAISQERAADIALADLVRFSPIEAGAADQVLSIDLVIVPRTGEGADLAWQVELDVATTEPDAPAEPWLSLVQAQSGALLAVLPAGGGCSLWDKLKCALLPNPAKAACLVLVCGGGAASVCGDHVCDGDETDANCRQDCGCSATSSCDAVAPYGCWCDADCAATADCCSDASTCYLPPEGGDDGTCEWGERSAGYLDRAKLTFYRAKYYAIAEAGGFLKDAPEARDYLLHYLGNSGTDVTADVDKMLSDIPSFTKKVEQDRIRYGEAAAASARAANATGPVTSAIPDEELSHSVEQAESYNWWAAIHRFEYKHVGEVTVTPVGATWEYTVTSVVVLRDKYDWDREAPNAGPGGAFNQRELDDLNCFGWAREFWVTGMSAEGEHMGVWQ